MLSSWLRVDEKMGRENCNWKKGERRYLLLRFRFEELGDPEKLHAAEA